MALTSHSEELEGPPSLLEEVRAEGKGEESQLGSERKMKKI
jgi:hypothetical protein